MENLNQITNEIASKKYVDDSIGEGTLVRFSQTLSNYLKVSFGNDTYNITKYDKIQLIDVTEIRSPNKRYGFLTKSSIKNLHKNKGTKAGNFLKTTVTNSQIS